MIEKTFLITGLGRSGTSFLAKLMNRSLHFNVVHEWHIPVPGFEDTGLKSFPIHRFRLARRPFAGLRNGYGEVNSYLRFFISADRPGIERLIPKKGIIHRAPEAVVASTMNRGGRTVDDFPSVCDRVLRMYWNLRAIRDAHPDEYMHIEFDELISDVAYVRNVLNYFGIDDVDVSGADLRRKVNVNKTNWFPARSDWSQEHLSLFASLNDTYGSGPLPAMPELR